MLKENNLKATPYKVENEDPERTYDIQENGDVIMTEVVKGKIWFSGREFITWLRMHESDVKMYDNQLSEKVRRDIEVSKKKAEDSIVVLSPLVEEVEKRLKVEYERLKVTGTVRQLKDEFVKGKGARKEYLGAIWVNVPEEHKSEVLELLSADEKSQLLKLKVDEKKELRMPKKKVV